MTTFSDAEMVARIAAWLDRTGPFGFEVGLNTRDTLGRAESLRARLRVEDREGVANEFGQTSELLDVSHALAQHLSSASTSAEVLHDVELAYAFVRSLQLDDEIGELEDILAEFAVTGWRSARSVSSYSEAEAWRRRLAQHVHAQEHTRLYLDLRPADRPAGVNDQFLSDPTVLVTATHELYDSLNVEPTGFREPAGAIYSWLVANPAVVDPETREHILGFAAMICAWSDHQAGNTVGWSRWLLAARDHFRRTSDRDISLALLDHVKLAHWHSLRRYDDVRSDIEGLIARMTSLGIHDRLIKTQFLAAANLKDLGRGDLALPLLLDILTEAESRRDVVMYSFAAAAAAQIFGQRGEYARGLELVDSAASLGIRGGSRAPAAIGWIEGTRGELLRGAGDIDGAIGAFRRCAALHAEAGMTTFAAYITILLADTLLAAGQEEAAVCALVSALPVITREGLSCEAEAAARLLAECLTRKHADATALRFLCGELRDMGTHNQL